MFTYIFITSDQKSEVIICLYVLFFSVRPTNKHQFYHGVMLSL